MVRTTGLEGAERETGIHHKNTADTHTLCPYIDRISGIGQGTVEREVQVDLETKAYFLQVGIALSLVIAAGEQDETKG